jgi:hypothetical protein
MLWFVFDTTTGQGPNPRGFRGETGIYVVAADCGQARLVGWRAMARGTRPASVGQRRCLIDNRPVRAPGEPRVVSTEYARELMAAGRVCAA